MYQVKEIFDTIQGEGARAGERSVFVRFAGCNLWNGLDADRSKGKGACALWCDTDFFGGEKMSEAGIVQRVNALFEVGNPLCDRWVVFSGGEPLLQLDAALIHALHDHRIKVAVETNGTVAVPGGVDWVCVSPKLRADGVALDLIVHDGQELKVVLPGRVPARHGWTLEDLRKLHRATKFDHYFVQPQDPVTGHWLGTGVSIGTLGTDVNEEYARNVEMCVQAVRELPRWRISFQSHKFARLP